MRGVAAMGIAWGGLLVAGCFFDPQGSVATIDTDGPGSTGAVTSGDSGGESDTKPTTTKGPTGGDSSGEASSEASSDTSPAVCGDGQRDEGEACDLGEAANGIDGADCKGDCTLNVCGDGYLAAGEGCDDGNDNDGDGCDHCVLASCGDGKVDPGEECDAGADNGGPACTGLCKLPVCGDGMVNGGEQCDAGGENNDAGMCTSQCKLAVCGDALVQQGVEACDDGNDAPGDGCEGCQVVKCGDGVVAGSEECDDGNAELNDTCGKCKRLAFYIFVTSGLFGGDFGGLVTADAQCMKAAEAGKLAGTYKAWLSDAEQSAGERLHHATQPYILPSSHKVVATSWSDLVDGMLVHAIDVTEAGQIVPGVGGNCLAKESLVWTGTTPTGAKADQHCNGWTSKLAMAQAIVGNTHEVDGGWSQQCSGSCTAVYRLYCVEQP